MNFKTSNRPLWVQVSESLRAFPTDLALILAILALVTVLYRVPGPREATVMNARIQTLVAIPTLLFVPGYVLVVTLFPGAPDHAVGSEDDRGPGPGRSIDVVERAALSFGMSVALVPLFALVVGSVWAFTPLVVLNGLSGLVFIGVVAAAVQRLRLPPPERFAILGRRWTAELRRGILHPDSVVGGLTNLILVLAVIAAIGAIGYAAATPYQSGQSSTLYLVTENETGAHLASGYPTEFTAGEGRSLTVGISNDEQRRQQYTVVVAVERVQTDGTEATVLESEELDRFNPAVPAGESWTNEHTVAPTLVGEELRLHYYLYRGGSVPSDVDQSSAYRDVYVGSEVAEA
jgi:uncharacterized membrane protein